MLTVDGRMLTYATLPPLVGAATCDADTDEDGEMSTFFGPRNRGAPIEIGPLTFRSMLPVAAPEPDPADR